MRSATAGLAALALLLGGCSPAPDTAPAPSKPAVTASETASPSRATSAGPATVTTPAGAGTQAPAPASAAPYVSAAPGEVTAEAGCRNCRRVIVTTANFPAPVSCSLAFPDEGPFGDAWTQAGTEVRVTPYFWGYPQLLVTCGGVVATVAWPVG